jgi:hypothetical protein
MNNKIKSELGKMDKDELMALADELERRAKQIRNEFCAPTSPWQSNLPEGNRPRRNRWPH